MPLDTRASASDGGRVAAQVVGDGGLSFTALVRSLDVFGLEMDGLLPAS